MSGIKAATAAVFNIVERVIRAALKPPPDVKSWEWMERFCRHDNQSSRRGQPWSSSTAFFVREICEEVANNERRQIALRCSAQSAKTLTIIQCVLWIICNDPGPLMWVMAAKDEAVTFMRQRLRPAFLMCAPVAALLPKHRQDNKSLEVNFPNMSANLRGADSPSKLQSLPIRWLILDEVRNYPKGALETVLKRIRTFWNARVVIISTPDKKKDAVDRAFNAGDQRHRYIDCPLCHEKQHLEFSAVPAVKGKYGLKWVENETTRPGGVWDYDALAQTVYYECKHCGGSLHDTPSTREAMDDPANGAEWRKHNPIAPKANVSFTWNALLPAWVRWVDIVQEYLKAKEALELGDPLPYKTFWTETLGLPWEDELAYIRNWDFLASRKVAYPLARNLPEGTPWTWEDETSRLLGVDVQGKGGRHFRLVARAFSSGEKGCNSRLIDYGTVWSWREVLEFAEKLNIPLDNILVDFAHFTSEVYTYVMESGYRIKPIRGDRAASFTVDGVKTIWRWTEVDPASGGKQQGSLELIRALLFSSSGAKDKLASYMNGITGFGRWEISTEVDDEYLSQVTAEERGEDGKWKELRPDNHFFDAEQMLIIGAMASGLIYAPEKVDKDQPELFPVEHAVTPKGLHVGEDGETEYYLSGQP